jgi:hypothetical protein
MVRDGEYFQHRPALDSRCQRRAALSSGLLRQSLGTDDLHIPDQSEFLQHHENAVTQIELFRLKREPRRARESMVVVVKTFPQHDDGQEEVIAAVVIGFIRPRAELMSAPCLVMTRCQYSMVLARNSAAERKGARWVSIRSCERKKESGYPTGRFLRRKTRSQRISHRANAKPVGPASMIEGQHPCYHSLDQPETGETPGLFSVSYMRAQQPDSASPV